mmetsp:Transcript_12849/g.35280  ORF Transcript_12849/g.35280 Transcript_12849/m.35280 type:complete len:220 (+) Transcript_12849:728-1387(+)
MRKFVKDNLPIPVGPEHGIGHDAQDALGPERGLRRVHGRRICGLEGRLYPRSKLLCGAKARGVPVKFLLHRLHACGEALALRENVVRDQLWRLQSERLSVPRLGVLREPPSLLLSLLGCGVDVIVAKQNGVLWRRRRWHGATCWCLPVGPRVEQLHARQQAALGEEEWPVVKLQRGGLVLAEALCGGQRPQKLRDGWPWKLVRVLAIDDELSCLGHIHA